MKTSMLKVQVSSWLLVGSTWAAEPLPLSTSYWRDEAFLKSFNGSYRIEARIEPTVSSEERGLLVEVQELMKAGRREAALEKVEGSSLTDDSAALTFNLANLQFEEGELEEAIESYEKAIEAYPSFRRAHRNLAVALVRDERLEEALPHLLEAIRLGDSDGATYGLLGYCRLQRGEWASALQAYRLAQLAEPQVASWKAGIAQCLQQMEAREEAAALLDEVLRQRPAEASYAMLASSVLIELGRLEEAVKVLELPRRLGVLDGDGLLLLAELELRSGRVEGAAARVEEAFKGEVGPEPDRVVPVASLAMAAREWQLAGRLLELGAGEEEPAPRALRRLQARLLMESGEDPAGGAGQLRELLEEDPTDGEVLLALGRYEVAEGREGEGALLWERATAVPETAADAWIELARLRVTQERYQAALEAVDEALARRPGGELEAYRESLARLVEAAG